MTAIIKTLHPSDINTTINHEPRVHDLRLAEVLGFKTPRNIRQLIGKHLPALDRLGTRCATQRVINGGKATEYYLTKKQAVYLAAKSETANAIEMTLHVIEVFDAATSIAPFTLPAKVTRAAKTLPAATLKNLKGVEEHLNRLVHGTEALKLIPVADPAAAALLDGLTNRLRVDAIHAANSFERVLEALRPFGLANEGESA